MQKRGVSRLFVQIFLSHRTEKLCWGTIGCIRKFRLSKIFLQEKGISKFSHEFFCLIVPKNFVGSPFCVSKKFRSRKFSCIGGGRHGIVEIFLSECRKDSWEALQCFRKIWVSKNPRHKKGISLFSVETFLSQSAEKIRGKPFNVSEKFGYRKTLGIKRGYRYFLLKHFCLRVPKIFVGKHLNVSEKFGYRKTLCIKRGYHYYPLKSFSLTLPKNFVGEPFWVSKKITYRKMSCIGRGAPRFCRNFFCLSANFLSSENWVFSAYVLWISFDSLTIWSRDS